jgi:hypothetical protein
MTMPFLAITGFASFMPGSSLDTGIFGIGKLLETIFYSASADQKSARFS